MANEGLQRPGAIAVIPFGPRRRLNNVAATSSGWPLASGRHTHSVADPTSSSTPVEHQLGPVPDASP